MKPTLLVLAAGLGTRYGGLKQIDSVGPNGETLIDYCLYDGVRAGFGKIVFVIRHYFEEAFKAKISSKYAGFVEVAHAYQELDACLGSYKLTQDREKPWGTGHAILVSREAIEEPFAVVNADDYYGANAFDVMARFLTAPDRAGEEYAMVGYTLRNTLSEYGSVARGVCRCDEGMYLKEVVERKEVRKTPAGAEFLDGDGTPQALTGNEIVSLNLWGFQPSIFAHLQAQFARFLANRGHEPNAEFFIPSAVDELIHSGKATVKVLPTHDSWFGITYRQDRAIAVRCMRDLIDKGVYPEKLWGS